MSLVIRFKRIISYPSHRAVVDAGIGGLFLMFTIITRAFFLSCFWSLSVACLLFHICFDLFWIAMGCLRFQSCLFFCSVAVILELVLLCA